MTADEIRDASWEGKWSDNSPESQVQILAEIAAQLAEINARMERDSQAIRKDFGFKPAPDVEKITAELLRLNNKFGAKWEEMGPGTKEFMRMQVRDVLDAMERVTEQGKEKEG